MPCKFSMVFMDYLRILGTENTAGGKHLATRVEGAPPCLVGPRWLPSTYASSHTLHLLPRKIPIQLKHEF